MKYLRAWVSVVGVVVQVCMFWCLGLWFRVLVFGVVVQV